MFRKIRRTINYMKLSNENNRWIQNSGNKNQPEPIRGSIEEIKKQLEDIFCNSNDVIIRDLEMGEKSLGVIIVYIDGMVNKQLINADVIKPLLTSRELIKGGNHEALLKEVEKKVLYAGIVKMTDSLQAAVASILSGGTAIFLDHCDKALMVGLYDANKRNVEEPPTDSVVRGPREGFTETLRINTALLRRKIKNTNLKFENMVIGEQTRTNICLCYIQGIAKEEIVEELKRRLEKIKIDAILESGYIEEFIEDSTHSIFPTVGNTEKPDIAAAKILEGRIAILCDGTPFVLTVPYLFAEAMQSSEDYYSRWIYSILVRFFRTVAIFITTLLPAYYVALVDFHQDVIPFKLILTMSASREGIPFSALTEALIMVVTFELIREAGIRMPRAIGQAVSIVGALVIGDAAVKAGLISTPMVIVIAITAISSFIIPAFAGAMLVVRLALLFAANIMGILGITLTLFSFFIHLCDLKSFGVPYMYPVMPTGITDLKDTFVRVSFRFMTTRPKLLTNKEGVKYRTRKSANKKEE